MPHPSNPDHVLDILDATALVSLTLTIAHEAVALRAIVMDEVRRLENLQGGRTHWAGCELCHPSCSALLRIRTALAAIDATRPAGPGTGGPHGVAPTPGT
jgi:hypothetical protein